MSEAVGLCSGVFPGTQTQRRDASRCGAEGSARSGESSSESEGEGEGEGEGGVVLSWAQRQKKLTTVFGRSGDPIEDEDMPTLMRKRKRAMPKPKPTKE